MAFELAAWLDDLRWLWPVPPQVLACGDDLPARCRRLNPASGAVFDPWAARIYLLADTLRSAQQASQAVIELLVAYHGLESLGGERLGRFWDATASGVQPLMLDGFAARYGLDMKRRRERRLALQFFWLQGLRYDPGDAQTAQMADALNAQLGEYGFFVPFSPTVCLEWVRQDLVWLRTLEGIGQGARVRLPTVDPLHRFLAGALAERETVAVRLDTLRQWLTDRQVRRLDLMHSGLLEWLSSHRSDEAPMHRLEILLFNAAHRWQREETLARSDFARPLLRRVRERISAIIDAPLPDEQILRLVYGDLTTRMAVLAQQPPEQQPALQAAYREADHLVTRASPLRRRIRLGWPQDDLVTTLDNALVALEQDLSAALVPDQNLYRLREYWRARLADASAGMGSMARLGWPDGFLAQGEIQECLDGQARGLLIWALQILPPDRAGPVRPAILLEAALRYLMVMALEGGLDFIAWATPAPPTVDRWVYAGEPNGTFRVAAFGPDEPKAVWQAHDLTPDLLAQRLPAAVAQAVAAGQGEVTDTPASDGAVLRVLRCQDAPLPDDDLPVAAIHRFMQDYCARWGRTVAPMTLPVAGRSVPASGVRFGQAMRESLVFGFSLFDLPPVPSILRFTAADTQQEDACLGQ